MPTCVSTGPSRCATRCRRRTRCCGRGWRRRCRPPRSSKGGASAAGSSSRCAATISSRIRCAVRLPEVDVGAFPPIGALLLPLRVGASRAGRAIVTGNQQTAEYWHEAGLVSLVPRGHDLLASAGEWFDSRLAGKSAIALSHAARAARALVRTQVEPLIAQLERGYLDELLATHDAVEGVDAWLAKRRGRCGADE